VGLYVSGHISFYKLFHLCIHIKIIPQSFAQFTILMMIYECNLVDHALFAKANLLDDKAIFDGTCSCNFREKKFRCINI